MDIIIKNQVYTFKPAAELCKWRIITIYDDIEWRGLVCFAPLHKQKQIKYLFLEHDARVEYERDRIVIKIFAPLLDMEYEIILKNDIKKENIYLRRVIADMYKIIAKIVINYDCGTPGCLGDCLYDENQKMNPIYSICLYLKDEAPRNLIEKTGDICDMGFIELINYLQEYFSLGICYGNTGNHSITVFFRKGRFAPVVSWSNNPTSVAIYDENMKKNKFLCMM